MSDAATAPASPKKTSTKKASAAPKAALHPTTGVMVKAAIKSLGEKGGSSLAAIKKYIEQNYKGIDMERQARFIRKCLTTGVEKGVFHRYQNKGHGASGKFQLSQEEKKAEKQPAKPKKPAAKKPAAKKPKAATKKTPTKKTTTAKKTASVKKTKPTKSPKKATKVKKATTTPAKKTPAKSAAKKKGPAKAKKPAAKK